VALFLLLACWAHARNFASNSYGDTSAETSEEKYLQGEFKSEGRAKREPFSMPNLPAAWVTIAGEFPRIIHNVVKNAEARYDAEANNIKAIDHSSQTSNFDTLRYQTQYDNDHYDAYGLPRNYYGERTLHKRSDDASAPGEDEKAQVFDPSNLRRILGQESFPGSTHFSKVRDYKPVVVEAVEAEPVQKESKVENSKPLKRPLLKPPSRFRVFKREEPQNGDTQDIDKDMVKALDNADMAEELKKEANAPAKAYEKILEAEKALDNVFHQVVGTTHETDDKDLDTIDSIMSRDVGSMDLIKEMTAAEGHTGATHSPTKRSAPMDAEEIMKDTIEQMEAVKKMLEDETARENALDALIKSEQEINQLVDMILEPKEMEKVAHNRRKRSHGVGYYDPEYQWLIKELDLPLEDQQSLLQIQKINSGSTSYHPHYDKTTAYDHHRHASYSPQYRGSYQADPVQTNYLPGSFRRYFNNPALKSAAPLPAKKLHYTRPVVPQQQQQQSPLQKLLRRINPIIPSEVEAAYQGAVEVGKHMGRRLEPIVTSGYKNLAYHYIPQVKKTVEEAVDRVPEDIKDFARQGRKIVTTRARLASELAEPSINMIRNDLWLMQQQLKQVAAETGDYTKKEVVPNILPTLKGLLFDLQETLELTAAIVQEDVKPLAAEVHREVIKPAYSEVRSKMVEPAARKVKDFVMGPVADTLTQYLVDPIAESASPVYSDYAAPALEQAAVLADSAVSGVKVAASTSQDVYNKALKPKVRTLAVSTQQMYHKSLKPKMKNIAASTQEVYEEEVKPRVEEATYEVVDQAKKLGHSIQKELVPPIKQGIKQTLHGVFTGIPTLVKKMSYEAHDAAKVFTGTYSETLQKMKKMEDKKRLELEILKNRIRHEEERLKADEEEASILDVADDEAVVESVKDDSESSAKADENPLPRSHQWSTTPSPATTQAPPKSSTEL